jgi:hypothetical protein
MRSLLEKPLPLRYRSRTLFTVVRTGGEGEKQEPVVFDQILLDR